MGTTVSDLVSEGKAWWKSKTIIGILIMIANPALKLFGIDLDVADVADVAFAEAEGLATQVDSIWGSVVTLFGAVLATWGRLSAKMQIKSIGGGGQNSTGGK